MLSLLMILLVAAGAQALSERQWSDPWTWTLEGEELRARHADTLDELLRQVPGLRVSAFGGGGFPFMARPGLGQGPLLVVDGLPLYDPWSGENLWPELPLSMVEKVEVELRPAALEYGGEASAGTIRVTTRRHGGSLSRAGIHVSPLMIGEPVTTRFSLETPPGGLALAISLDENQRDPVAVSDSPTAGVESRVLLTRMDLDGGVAGPLELQLVQSRGSRGLSLIESRDAYRLSLALPKGPAGSWRLRQSFEGRKSEQRELALSGFQLYWSSRSDHLDKLSIRAFGGMEVYRPEIQDQGLERERLPGQGRAWLALSRRQTLFRGLSGNLGLRAEMPRDGEMGLLGEARLSRPLADRPMRLEAFLNGGRQSLPWDRHRLEGLGLWPSGPSLPSTESAADFYRAGLSLGAWTASWHWTFGFWTESGELWSLEKPDDDPAAWVLSDPGRRSGLSFSGQSALPVLRRILDAGTLQFFRLLGAGDRRFDSSMSGSIDLQAEMDEREGHAPYRIRAGLDYRRSIAGGDGHWRILCPLEWRGGGDAEESLVLDFSAELRVLDGRIWVRSRNLLDSSYEEIGGFSMPGRETRIGVEWILMN